MKEGKINGAVIQRGAEREILKNPGETRGFALNYGKDILKTDFTFIKPYVDWLREKKGVDITARPICIASFYHAANGGVKIDRETRTAVRGLFACGECSGGIHGADRPGGHSTGSCLVFGAIAGKQAARYAKQLCLRDETRRGKA